MHIERKPSPRYRGSNQTFNTKEGLPWKRGEDYSVWSFWGLFSGFWRQQARRLPRYPAAVQDEYSELQSMTAFFRGYHLGISGTCNENVDVNKSGLTIDGNNAAIIDGARPSPTHRQDKGRIVLRSKISHPFKEARMESMCRRVGQPYSIIRSRILAGTGSLLARGRGQQ